MLRTIFLLTAAVVSAAQAQPAKTSGTEDVKDVIILGGGPLGGVKFEHRLHVERDPGQCVVCHHTSKPEKPETKPNQACRDCHTKPLPAGMKTTKQAAFHRSSGQAGLCIDCHKQVNAKGKKSPQKCVECHLKENKPVAGGFYAQPWHRTARVHEVGGGRGRPH